MLRKVLLALPVTLLFSAACYAQTVSFEGDVKGEDGKPVQKAVIKIDRKDIKGNYKVNTDKKGHYFYGGLPNGTYKISVEIDGKERDMVDNVKSKFGDPTNVSFDLAQAAARAGGGAPKEEAPRNMSEKDKAAYEKKKADQEAALKKNKELNDAFNQGVEAQNQKNFDVAVQQFEKASTLGPDQNVVWGRLADSYTSLAGVKTGAEQEAAYGKAVAAYQKAIELKPDAPEYHNNYALALAKQKKFDEAQAELTKAAALDPTQAGKYYYNLGAVLVNTGQNDAASAAFKKAIDAQPDYADAYVQYGITLMGKATVGADGKMVPVAGTAEAFNKYLELAPNGPQAETAKAMLQSIGASVETNFSKPGEKKAAPTKKKSQ